MEQMQKDMQATMQRVDAMETALTQASAASAASSQRALDAEARAHAAQSATAALDPALRRRDSALTLTRGLCRSRETSMTLLEV